MKIVFATGNVHKLREAQEILGEGYELVTPASLGITEEIPETGDTLEANSLQKAEFLSDKAVDALACFADDYPDLTVAEISEEAKNAISHRGKALRAMAEWLRAHPLVDLVTPSESAVRAD